MKEIGAPLELVSQQPIIPNPGQAISGVIVCVRTGWCPGEDGLVAPGRWMTLGFMTQRETSLVVIEVTGVLGIRGLWVVRVCYSDSLMGS